MIQMEMMMRVDMMKVMLRGETMMRVDMMKVMLRGKTMKMQALKVMVRNN